MTSCRGSGRMAPIVCEQPVDALARAGRDEQRRRLHAAEHQPRRLVGEVGLVEHDLLGHVARTDLGDHLAHGRELRGGIGVGGVDDVQDEVGVLHLLQRRAERLHQLVRQVADEADRVDQRVGPAVGRLRPADGRVQRREQRVLDERARPRDAVQQARLAGVRVARRSRRTAPRCGRGSAASRSRAGAMSWISGAASPCGSGCAGDRARSSSHRGRASPCPHPRRPPGHRPGGTSSRPSRGGAAAGTGAARARPAPCPRGSSRAG